MKLCIEFILCKKKAVSKDTAHSLEDITNENKKCLVKCVEIDYDKNR